VPVSDEMALEKKFIECSRRGGCLNQCRCMCAGRHDSRNGSEDEMRKKLRFASLTNSRQDCLELKCFIFQEMTNGGR